MLRKSALPISDILTRIQNYRLALTIINLNFKLIYLYLNIITWMTNFQNLRFLNGPVVIILYV